MSAPYPEDQPNQEALRRPLEAWLKQQNQALLEEVIATWQGAMDRFHPDEALLSQLQGAASQGGPSSDAIPSFAAALDLVEGAPSQGDLLKRLLDGLAPLVERSALFVLKQGLATLYAHRGFDQGAPLKTGAVVPPPDLEAIIQGLGRSLRKKGPGYSALLSVLSSYEAADLAIMPLRHRRKTVALLLVDSGLRQKLDHPELVRALILVASAALANLASGKEDGAHLSSDSHSSSAPTQAVPESIAPAPAASLDPKTRTAAERLARVLVGDVELYFPAKVAQARSQGNLYGLLRDELDRSRATFVDRFGEEIESQHRIFTTTVIHQLCDGNAAKLGRAPWA